MAVQIGQLVQVLLTDDLQSYPERTGGLDEAQWDAFGEIVGAAFYRAVGERFTEQNGGSELTDFVAEACAPYDGTPVAVDPGAAEALVRSVLGDETGVSAVLEELDEPDLARIELILLRALISDRGADAESIEELVASARTDAAQFTGEAGTEA